MRFTLVSFFFDIDGIGGADFGSDDVGDDEACRVGDESIVGKSEQLWVSLLFVSNTCSCGCCGCCGC